MADFITYEVAISPTWLQRHWGEAWTLVQAVVKDAMISGAKDAVKARFIEFAPEDALTKLGIERQLPKVTSETVAAYRLRLLAAWDTWSFAGTKIGVVSALTVLGYTVTLLENADWTPDFAVNDWWRFWVFLVPTVPFVDDGSPATLAKIADIRNTIALWKAAHALLIDLVVLPAGAELWDFPTPVGAWDSPVATWDAAGTAIHLGP